MRTLTVYADESGNTGDAAKLVDAFGGQPSFALVGVGEPAGSGILQGVLDDLRVRHRVQAPEFKAKTLTRNAGLGLDLVTRLANASVPMFIELMDKRYFLSVNIVNHFLAGAWLDMSSAKSLQIANLFADLLTSHIPDGHVVPYLAFTQAPTEDTLAEFTRNLRSDVGVALHWAPPNLSDALSMLAEAIDLAIAQSERGGHDGHDLRHLLPSADHAPRGTRYAILPHVNAFVNLYSRVNLIAAEWDAAKVIHDDQHQVEQILREYAAGLESNTHFDLLSQSAAQEHVNYDFSAGKLSLDFTSSHATAGIQVADLVAAICTRRMSSIIEARPDDDLREEVRLLSRSPRPGVGLNLVTTFARVDEFYRL
jgi:hypothetical protein